MSARTKNASKAKSAASAPPPPDSSAPAPARPRPKPVPTKRASKKNATLQEVAGEEGEQEPALPVQVIVKQAKMKPRTMMKKKEEVIDIADSDEEDPEASDGHDDVPSSVTEEAVEVADDGEDDQSDVCESEDEEEEDGSRLAPGDSVYQDNAVSHRIEHADLAEPSPFTTRSAKRGRVSAGSVETSGGSTTTTGGRVKKQKVVQDTVNTPPPTRSTTKQQKGGQTIQEPSTPTKNLPALQDAAEITPVKQLRRMELKTPVRGGTSDPQTPAKGVAGAAKFDFKAVAARKAASPVKAHPLNDPSTVYLEDLRNVTVCQVTDVALQDPVLLKLGLYNNLPPLKSVNMIPSKEYSNDVGFLGFSLWTNQIPDFPVKTVQSFFSFVSGGRFFDPSRCDPKSLKGTYSDNKMSCVLRTLDGKPAVMVSVGGVRDSNIVTLNQALQYSGHRFTAVLHNQEHQRAFAAMGQIASLDSFRCAMWENAVTFTTKSAPKETSSSNPKFNMSALFTPAASPAKKAAIKTSAVVDDLLPLSHGDTIPVYDLRPHLIGEDIIIDKDLFEHLEVLDRFEGEIPKGSCVVIGYLAHFQMFFEHGTKSWRLMLYAQWVLLVATP